MYQRDQHISAVIVGHLIRCVFIVASRVRNCVAFFELVMIVRFLSNTLFMCMFLGLKFCAVTNSFSIELMTPITSFTIASQSNDFDIFNRKGILYPFVLFCPGHSKQQVQLPWPVLWIHCTKNAHLPK